VLAFALEGLSRHACRALQVVAAFSMPTTIDTLLALLVGGDRACPDEATLDDTLRDLEDRGLLGWDRNADRYDLHPIVRGVAWDALNPADRRQTCALLEHHFAALPPVSDRDVLNLDALAPTQELFHVSVRRIRAGMQGNRPGILPGFATGGCVLRLAGGQKEGRPAHAFWGLAPAPSSADVDDAGDDRRDRDFAVPADNALPDGRPTTDPATIPPNGSVASLAIA
jgi:hypothetical protein